MVLANVITIAVLKYCIISFQCKSLCLRITDDVSKIAKIVQCELIFNFIEISETLNNFVKMYLVLEIRNVASFIKTRFYWKRDCIKMRNQAETFYPSTGCKLTIVDFIPTSAFSKQEFWVHF